jgi:hypothetical protein
MVDHQEDTWVLTRPWIRSNKGITDFMQNTMMNGAGAVTPVQPVAAHEPGGRGLMHQYNVKVTLERIVINIAGPFPLKDQGNWYLLIAMDYLIKWWKTYAIPNQEASMVAKALVTNFFVSYAYITAGWLPSHNSLLTHCCNYSQLIFLVCACYIDTVQTTPLCSNGSLFNDITVFAVPLPSNGCLVWLSCLNILQFI